MRDARISRACVIECPCRLDAPNRSLGVPRAAGVDKVACSSASVNAELRAIASVFVILWRAGPSNTRRRSHSPLFIGQCRGPLYAVAPPFFRFVARLVGRIDQFLVALHARLPFGNAGAHRHRNSEVAQSNRGGRELPTQPFCQDRGAVDGGGRQQGQEFFAAVSSEGVSLAYARAYMFRGAAQHLVAGEMAVVVVAGLEIVEIEEEQRQGAAVTLDALDLFGNRLFNIAAVMDAGEPVAAAGLGQ